MDKKNFSQEDIDSLLIQYKTEKNKKTKAQLKDFIVLTCLPLVKTLAHSIARRSNDPIEDIVQIGCIGLIKAIDLYKPMPEKHFKSYAKVFIIGEIKHYLRDNSELIKSSRAMRELSYKINKIVVELTENLGHHPTDEEIANALDVPSEKVTECITQERRTSIVSIDNSNDDSEDSTYSLVEKIEDSKAKQTILSYENKMLLDEIINKLEPMEQDLVRDYYYEELTYTELSLRYNLSQAKITSKLKYAVDFIVKTLSEKGINNLEEE